MPQIDFDGANSAVKTDKIQGQSGTTVTVTTGHNLAGSGSGLTALNAANIASGTLPMARLSGTLPALNGSALTNLPSSSGFKFLAHTSGSDVAAIEFNAASGVDNTTYAGYLFHCTRMFPHTNGRVGMRVSDDDGSTWKASGYKCHLHSIDEDGLEQVGTSSSENTIRFCTNSNGNSAGFFSNCQVYFPADTVAFEYGYANIQGGFREDSSSYDSYACYGSGAHAASSAAGGWDAFQFLAESGNITGKITMYGLLKA